MPEGIIGNGLPTLLARSIIRQIKDELSFFVHGVNNVQMAQIFEKSWERVTSTSVDPIVGLCADSSNHDGH